MRFVLRILVVIYGMACVLALGWLLWRGSGWFGVADPTPALLQSRCTVPNVSTASSRSAATWSGSETSQCTARTVPPAVMSFGDGNHRCPGAALAILESEIFLSALFALDIVADGPPRVGWNPVSQGYDLDRLMVRRAAMTPWACVSASTKPVWR